MYHKEADMKRKYGVLRILTALWVGLLLSACGAPEVAPTPTEVPPTATALPPTDTPVPTEAPTATPEEDETAWDYVALGDCVSGGGVGFGRSYLNLYAAYIAEDLGVEVKLHNRCVSSEKTASLLTRLQNDETVRQEVGEAEVITVWVGSNDIWDLIYGADVGSEPPACGPLGEMDLDCVREVVQVEEDNLDAILAEILSLRGADEALIRIADSCNWFVEPWRDAGAFEELKEPAFEHWSRAISDLAAKHGVAVVHTHAAFNGPDGDEAIPPEYRHPNPTEWYHVNEAGHVLIADLHRAVGYEHSP